MEVQMGRSICVATYLSRIANFYSVTFLQPLRDRLVSQSEQEQKSIINAEFEWLRDKPF
jgi:hypothetical protein